MKAMILDNETAFDAVLLGCVVQIWSRDLGVEMSRGFGPGVPRDREPDLRITPYIVDGRNTGVNECRALTSDGEAYLDLVAEQDGFRPS